MGVVGLRLWATPTPSLSDALCDHLRRHIAWATHRETDQKEMLRSEHRLRLEEVSVPENFVPRRLGDLNLSGRDYLLLAVRHGSDWQFNPPPEFEIRPYQVLVVMATPQGRHQVERLLHG